MSVQLLHGDCLAILPTLPPASIDALITDPPYSSGGAFRGDRASDPVAKYASSDTIAGMRTLPTFGGDTRDQRSYFAWMTLWLSGAVRALRPGAAVALFTDWRQLPVMTDAFQAAGLVWRGVAVWDKTGAARNQIGRLSARAEFVLWGSLGSMPFARGTPAIQGVFQCAARTGARRRHLTEKPEPVMRWLVALCPPGGTILDPFAGSGTTGIAALAHGCSFIGIEQDETYCRIARERIAAAGAEEPR